MFDADAISTLRDQFQSSSSFLILLKSNPSLDQVAASLALLNALQNQKKEAYIVCADPMRVEFGNLVGVDQVQQNIGNRSLQVSFDYDEKTIENVSYNIDHENKKFHLVIRPQKGHRPLDPTSVQYSHTGLDAHMIFMVGVGDYNDIKQYYEQEEQSFHQSRTVSINKFKATFATINLDGSEASSFSEMMYTLLGSLDITLNSDAATNILAGIEQATDTFRHYSVTADTFETVAKLMRQGARRIRTGGTSQPTAHNTSLAQAFSSQLNKPNSPLSNLSITSAQPKPTTGSVQQLQRVQMPGAFSPDKR